MIVLLSDPRLARIPIRDTGETLVDVRESAPLRVAGRTFLRSGLVDRLVTAQSLLPRRTRLLIVDGYRAPALPCGACAVEEAEPGPPAGSRPAGVCATPADTAPHPTGGAVDLTLADGDDTVPLPACRAGPVPPPPAGTRRLLTAALAAVGLVNHPARWWHWSYGDRFWAWATRAPHARYGPAFAEDVAHLVRRGGE
jgi:D-alanyl-D-alanine dipeptidase